MTTEIVMPDMGNDMTEGKLVRWLKREGEVVEAGEPLVEIETDKVNIEVEAPESGTLRRIVAVEGATIPVGQRLAELATD